MKRSQYQTRRKSTRKADLRRLGSDGVVLPEPGKVRSYLARHRALARLIPAICTEARKEFGEAAELSLELYRDPEIYDRHLILYVRLPAYDESILQRLDRVTQPFDEGLSTAPGHFLVTTDLRPPRAKHAI
jgi:hypothetical protein